jgi:hypothetical protein
LKLTFFGAAGEVTGSCLLVEAGGARFLVDCGMFQGARNAAQRGYGIGLAIARAIPRAAPSWGHQQLANRGQSSLSSRK